MINCECVIIQRVVSLFFRLNFNKLYQMNETNVVEITFAISRTFQNPICVGNMSEKKLENAPEVNLRRNLPLHILPPSHRNNLTQASDPMEKPALGQRSI